MERAAAGIASATGLGPSTPLIVNGRQSLPSPETPRPVERFPIIAGSGGRPTGSRRTTKDHAVLSITVSAGQVLGMRKAVVALAHSALELLTVTPLAGGSQVRLTAYLASDFVEALTTRILEFVADRNPAAKCVRSPTYTDDASRGNASAIVV